VRAVKVRELGQIVLGNEVEAIVVDDALGFVYYAEEPRAIHKWHADPGHEDAARELARFGEGDFRADREGLAVYGVADGSGLLLATDQLLGASRYLGYRREGRPGAPHDHSEVAAVLEGGADATDGLDATATPLGPSFPHGLIVAMNDRGRNFLFYRPEDLGLVSPR
jgi:3-phytase